MARRSYGRAPELSCPHCRLADCRPALLVFWLVVSLQSIFMRGADEIQTRASVPLRLCEIQNNVRSSLDSYLGAR